MQKVKKWLNKIDKKQKIILLIVLLVVASCITTFSVQIVKQIRKSILAKHELLEWKIQERDRYTAKILIKVTSVEGIEQIEFPDGDILYCNNKMQVGIDYDIVGDTEYNFKIKEVGKEKVTETVYWEIPRVQGDYTLKERSICI